MAFRSHLARRFDPGRWSNRILFFLVAGFGVVAVVSWADGDSIDVLLAPAQVFAFWALVREVDPDHDWTALVAGAVAGGWVLVGYPVVSVLVVGGLALGARVVLNSTGRRPLATDLVVIGAYATAISFTRIGWVSGFGLAVAIYIDARLAEGSSNASVATAGLAALGASLVATAADAFPDEGLEVRPMAVGLIGLVGLLAIVRPPPEPFSVVDSRKKWRMSRERLHGARALFGALVFVAALLSGGNVEALTPLVLALVLALASAEVERLRRPV